MQTTQVATISPPPVDFDGIQVHAHALRADSRGRNTCDLHNSADKRAPNCSGRGTAFRCASGCDFDVCQACWDHNKAKHESKPIAPQVTTQAAPAQPAQYEIADAADVTPKSGPLAAAHKDIRGQGYTPLHLAVSLAAPASFVRTLLLANPASATQLDVNGDTPLKLARRLANPGERTTMHAGEQRSHLRGCVEYLPAVRVLVRAEARAASIALAFRRFLPRRMVQHQAAQCLQALCRRHGAVHSAERMNARATALPGDTVVINSVAGAHQAEVNGTYTKTAQTQGGKAVFMRRDGNSWIEHHSEKHREPMGTT